MISIITPVYNSELYIRDCIQSVADQYFEGLEHVIVDGGSKDKTVEIIQELSQKYTYIRWISEKDKGQSDAMNKGIALAKNPVISFLNADDRYENKALSTALQFFKTVPPDTFFVGNCRVLKEDGTESMINKPFPFSRVSFMLDFNFPFNPSAYFYHKSLHQKAGLYAVEDHLTMDIDFIFRLFGKANMVYIDQILGNYVQVSNSKTMKEISAGRNVENLYLVFDRYKKEFTLKEKLQWTLLNAMGKNRGWMMYYLSNPGAFIKKLFGVKPN